MEPTWHSPDSWQKDGSSLSGISNVKKGAWTSILKATETHNGRTTEVIIKAFAVPEEIHQDPQRIAVEREKFLDAARMQYSLTQAGARAWVKILRISDDPQNPSFSMEKCGPSIQDLLDNKVQLQAKDFYALVQSLLQALIEIKDRQKRSHGNIKPSDVLSALPGEQPPYKLGDPSSKGEEHFANDLYALGLIVFQLIEYRQWDPLNPIMPTKTWNRFGGKRDRWIQFLNLLLNPNGCHEPLEDVRREALRLKPSSPMKLVYVLAALLILFVGLVGAGALGYHLLATYVLHPTPQVPSGSATGGGTAANAGGQGGSTTTPQATVQNGLSPEVLALNVQALKSYTDVRARWTAAQRTPRFDHTKSRALAQEARSLAPADGSVPDASHAAAFTKAAGKLEEALIQLATEETAGKQQDAVAFAELTRAQTEFKQARFQWEAAAAKLTPDRDHSRSKTLAQAAILAAGDPASPPPADPAVAQLAAQQFRKASRSIADALALIPDEDKAAGPPPPPPDESHTAFEAARRAYEQARDQWTATAELNKDVELTAARTRAQEARALLPDQIVLTDAASYRTMADLYARAAHKFQEAVALIDDAKKSVSQNQGEIAAAVQSANTALQQRKFDEALAHYRKAADLGSAPAMLNVGRFYETGQGTPRDLAQAASWYRKASEAQLPAAMYNLALLYESGRGVDRDYAQAAAWYRKAADAKNASAMDHLGYLFEHGWGVPQDYAQALSWYRQAAALNDAAAMYNIGVLFDKGRGVKSDPAEALQWYRKAADLGNAAAMNGVGALYDAGRGVRSDYREAMKWYQQAADKKFAPAMCNIGVLYDNGLGTAVNHGEAMKWFRQAAELDDGLSMFNMGLLYERGLGVPADVVQAVNWYRKAFKSDDDNARQLSTEALDRLGYAHQ